MEHLEAHCSVEYYRFDPVPSTFILLHVSIARLARGDKVEIARTKDYVAGP